MSPADREEFRKMLALALQPMQEQIDALKYGAGDGEIQALRREITELKAVDKKHSGQHREVRTELLPRMQSEVDHARKSDLSAIALAYERLAHLANDTNDRIARIEERGNQSLVKVTDSTGSTSIKPASMVAAETAQRTEGQTKALQGRTEAIQVAADRADTNALGAQRWAKRGLIISLVVQAVIAGIMKAWAEYG